MDRPNSATSAARREPAFRFPRKFLPQRPGTARQPIRGAWYVPSMKVAKTSPNESMRDRSVDELSIRDQGSFRHVKLYGDLKEVLRRDRYSFRILPNERKRWDRALLLNLTFWRGVGGDVLEGPHVAADVVMHAAWHHLAARALAGADGSGLSVEALILGESIASAFDIYLVGRLMGGARPSSFLDTQVPAMAEAAKAA